MTFSNDFYSQIYPEWASEYVSYQTILRGLESSINWDHQDEHDFKYAIESEFQRVNTFITKKERDIQANISYLNRFHNNENNEVFDTLTKLKSYIRSNYQALEDLIYQHNTKGREQDLFPFFIELNKKYRLDTQRLYPLLLQLNRDNDDNTETDVLHATYWIDQSCVNEVKSILLFQLPITTASTIHQTYFDNPRFKSYLSNLQYDQDAEMITSQMDNNNNNNNSIDIINTKITNHDKPVVVTTTTIQKEQLNEYLSSIDSRQMLQVELDQSVYSDKDLTITLENNITFIKDSNMKNVFPFAVLQINIGPSTNTTTLEWLLSLLNSNLVYPVSCYSNILEGVAHFYHKELCILPAWWPIPNNLFQTTSDTMNKRSILTNLNQIGYLEQQLDKQLKEFHHLEMNRQSTSSTTEQESDKMTVQTIEKTVVQQIEGHPSTAHLRRRFKSNEKSPFVEYSDEKRIQLENNPNYTILIEDSDDEEKRLRKERKEKKKEKKLKKFLKSTEGTIEPKLFFANERTFIHWLQFSALILSAALTLLNFGDRISVISGATFFGISLVLALYAFFRYRYRAYQMSNTPHVRFDDIYGPVGLCVLIIGAMVLNFVLRWEHPPSTDTYLGTNNQTQQQQNQST